MLIPDEDVKIFVYFKPVDMRKAIDGLSALVVTCLNKSPSNGDLFIFRNKRGDKIKIIYWDRNGFVMYYKRLDKGGFKFPKTLACDSINISKERLDWLLMGFDFMLNDTQEKPEYIYHF